MNLIPFIAAELQSILEPFLLRRVKSQVAVDLPKKTELVVYHGMSALQKKYYKAVLMKDLGETWALWCAVSFINAFSLQYLPCLFTYSISKKAPAQLITDFYSWHNRH